ncbi:MAG: DUF1592 domain-containing protein [Pirellulales bacterium]|nr:DUF1592 domain-containing protein [Pirellulales bacterium]
MVLSLALPRSILLAENPTDSASETTRRYRVSVEPLLKKHCFQCHGDKDEVRGEVNFRVIETGPQIKAAFELWSNVLELIETGSMPPETQPRLTPAEIAQFKAWYQQELVDTIAPLPDVLRPRRLSAHEYRQTLRSLFGFDLEVSIAEAEQTVVEKSLVMKLLPVDPPGPSGFKNDTSANPLTTNVWEQYSFLLDDALEQWLSPGNRNRLEVVTGPITSKHMTPEQCEKLLNWMLRRIYRRTPTTETIQTCVASIRGKEGTELESALRMELKSVLMSLPFIYRGLLATVDDLKVRDQDDSPVSYGRVDDHELAERLSYFLWGDMPDERLMQLADEGTLRIPETYASEIARMLADPKSRNLAENFGLEWFSLDEILTVSKNPPVSHALRQQPIDFLNYLFIEGRPLLELIDSKVAFVNPHTAKFYPGDRKRMAAYKKQRGIEVEAVPNQRLELVGTSERGGLLTMPGILAMNRGPVIRGTWMLEKVLGEHLPDPPANVGQVKPNQPGENLTFRERFELHRSDATCAICHNKIDPLGFAMQAYDSTGAYNPTGLNPTKGKNRKQKKNKVKEDEHAFVDPPLLDTSGRLPGGQSFENFRELKQILLTSQRRRIIENIVKRTLSYALARELNVHDMPTVDEISSELDRHGNLELREGSYHDLIHLVVNSLPFTHAQTSQIKTTD